MMQASTTPSVTELRVSRDRRQLTVRYADGEEFAIPAELLRVLSPSAEVRGHSPEQRKLVSGKRSVEIIGVVAVGNYAVRISFDDLHDTGIYSWPFLRDLGMNQSARMQDYEAELKEKGQSRDA